MNGLSGFCSTAPGIHSHAYSHEVCEKRINEGLLLGCSCPDHPRNKGSEHFDAVESEAQSGPESAGTDRGQTDWLGVDR